jgi:hypothetical protein
MKTFIGQKNWIVVSAIQLLLTYCQENLFVKSLCCEKEVEAFSSLISILCNLHPHTHTHKSKETKYRCASKVNKKFTFSLISGLISFHSKSIC